MALDTNPGTQQHCEAITADGRVLRYTCPPDAADTVKAIIGTHVRSLFIPSTARVSVGQGGYGTYTRYNIRQHKYAGGGHPGFGGFTEVLEIRNPPDGRCPFILHSILENPGVTDCYFTEWASLESARNAFDAILVRRNQRDMILTQPGFLRFVDCGELTPWFYAIGNQLLLGDYAFPERLQQDPFFRFGRRFIVTDREGLHSVKTCYGCRNVAWRDDWPGEHGQITRTDRIVFWSDVTMWRESHFDVLPRPIDDEEAVSTAVTQFVKLLAGDSTGFTINFVDGSAFVGTFKPVRSDIRSPAGDYNLEVQFDDGEVKTGWVKNFEPTADVPTILARVKKGCPDKAVTRVTIKERNVSVGGRKWAGIFHRPLR